MERLCQAVPEVEVITPNISRWGSTAIFGDKKSSCAVRGLQPDYEKIEAQNITMGRFINDVDILESRKVCTIGKRVYDELFPQGGNPCGQYLRVDGIYYQIVGVSLSTSNMNINAGTEDSVTLPFTTIKKAHYIHPDDKQAVIMVNAEAMFSMIDNLFTGIKILAWMVGLGTLLAGAIGVSNIMMVTVKERTTEIGIRRAIGARPKDILNQILSESMVLTTFAVLMGFSFGGLILLWLEFGTAASGTEAHFQISFWMAGGACILLMVLGMLAGLAPAYRAMAIKPIEAIRDE